MKFNPPRIEHISDVLPHIKDNDAFIVADKGWYKVIDYVYAHRDTFTNDYARECRGLKFCGTTGKLLARPYHKFHNLGENSDYQVANVDLSQPHVVLDKLDGSMVHTCPGTMGMFLMTRMGCTDVAAKADAFLMKHSIRYTHLFDALGWEDYTYIFEYVAPHNKIVIHYEEENLILTGIRHVQNGTYVFHNELVKLGEAFSIPVVKAYDVPSTTNIDSLDEKVRVDEVNEGIVVRFDTGAMVKIKADAYVRKHRFLDQTGTFKGVIQLIVERELDDVIANAGPELSAKLCDYEMKLMSELAKLKEYVEHIVTLGKDLDQKQFALCVQALDCKAVAPILFTCRKGDDAMTTIMNRIRSLYNHTDKLTAFFTELEFPIWA